SPASAIAEGVGYVPEDRLTEGLFLEKPIQDNITLPVLDRLRNALGMISQTRARRLAEGQIADLQIVAPDVTVPVQSLSGGNQQKVVIGKMLATQPRVIMLDEPSRGIDIGAKAEVFRLLAEGALKGLAVVYSTSEVSECLSIAHRIIVMHKGRISAEFDSSVSKEQIMAASGESMAA
ncbi:MAG: ATP-binding cassette domain-containing protein, partial [Pararhodobacter sp.]